MRINIYAEELTLETEVVTKNPSNHPDVTFYGIRCYLASPASLHAGKDDDDRSAITFWVPWTKAHGHNYEAVESLLEEMLERIRGLTVGKKTEEWLKHFPHGEWVNE